MANVPSRIKHAYTKPMRELTLRSPVTEHGAPVYHLAETPSTMDDAVRLARRGTPSGTVVVTDHQSAGRGRRAGRVWQSPPCESLMFTLLLYRPTAPTTRSLVMAAAIARLLEEEADLEPEVKWPNDVLVGGRKICGILADHDGTWLALGVGLNVRQTRFPEEIASHATSLVRERPGHPCADSPWEKCRNGLLSALLGGYARSVDDWHQAISARLWMRGREIALVSPDGSRRRGVLAGLDRDGTLLLRDAGGLHRIAAGEVSLIPDKLRCPEET